MAGRLGVTMAIVLILASAGRAFSGGRSATSWKEMESADYRLSALQDCTADAKGKNVVFRKEGNRVSIPGAVSVELEEWEAVYIPIDVETDWFKSTRNTRKPVLVRMTATPSTYLPFSDNAEYVALMENAEARRDFLYGLEKASGRDVDAVQKVNHAGRDYIGTRFESGPDEKVLFTLGSIAKNGLMVAFTFCFDQADEKAVTDFDGTSIISVFLENVNFGSALHFEF